jgi:hypothetical protein
LGRSTHEQQPQECNTAAADAGSASPAPLHGAFDSPLMKRPRGRVFGTNFSAAVSTESGEACYYSALQSCRYLLREVLVQLEPLKLTIDTRGCFSFRTNDELCGSSRPGPNCLLDAVHFTTASTELPASYLDAAARALYRDNFTSEKSRTITTLSRAFEASSSPFCLWRDKTISQSAVALLNKKKGMGIVRCELELPWGVK